MRHLVFALLAMAVAAAPLHAQSGAQAPPPVLELNLDGPRVA